MEENVIPIKAPPTLEEELEETRKSAGRLLYEAGELQYKMDIDRGSLGELNVKLRNLNTRGHDLQQRILKEKASKLTVEKEEK